MHDVYVREDLLIRAYIDQLDREFESKNQLPVSSLSELDMSVIPEQSGYNDERMKVLAHHDKGAGYRKCSYVQTIYAGIKNNWVQSKMSKWLGIAPGSVNNRMKKLFGDKPKDIVRPPKQKKPKKYWISYSELYILMSKHNGCKKDVANELGVQWFKVDRACKKYGLTIKQFKK